MSGQGSFRISATAAAPGVVGAGWTELQRAALPPPRHVAATEASAEVARLRAAANEAALELMDLSDEVAARGHDDEAGIFAAHAAIAWDPELIALTVG